MIAFLILFAGSLALSLALTPLVRALALRVQLVDHPDGRRKMHERPVAVAGGLILFASMTVALFAAVAVLGLDWFAVPEVWVTFGASDLVGLALASLLICGLGMADDFHWLRVRHKFLGQILAALVVIACGVEIEHIRLFGWTIELGILSIPFTLFLLLGAINSLNLIDGMDGLLSTVGVIVSLAVAGMALQVGQWLAACVALSLAGALLGFLRYNLPPATIFLGDSGSMLIGLVLGVLAIKSSLKTPTTVALMAPAALLTIPIFDTFVAILRRKLTGRSIYSTDRAHLHHCLLSRGLSRWRVLCLVAGFCLLTGIGALLSLALNNELFALLSSLAVVTILVACRLFGHTELRLLRQRVQSLVGSFLRGPAEGEARQLEVRLQGSVEWSELWLNITACGQLLNLRTIRLDVNAPAIFEGYHASWQRAQGQADEATSWRAEIPLVARGQAIGRLQVVGEQDEEPVWQKIATLAKLVQDFELTASQLTHGAWAATTKPTPPDSFPQLASSIRAG
jgi:UDP-GlcNAc:undecaprenyl-phosphate GlcNAc-1-phosphate transferase